MKTYVLMVSRYFPKTHKRAGEPTHFADLIYFGNKKHTIRSNFLFWQKRISEIQKGNAILSIRYWSGKPYNSKQVEVCQLDKDSGISVEMLRFIDYDINQIALPLNCQIDKLSLNDGLSLEDFKEWFQKYDLSKPMAIIHFTPFRYFS